MSNIINTVHAKYNELQSNYVNSKDAVKATIATKTATADAKFAGKKIKMALAHAYITVSSYMKPSHIGKMLAFRGLQVALVASIVVAATLLLANFRGIHCLIRFAKDATILAVMLSIAYRILSIDIRSILNKIANKNML